MQQEKDPNGKQPHEPGAKLDLGKPLSWLVISGFANAIQELIKVGTDGAIKYSPEGWKQVGDAKHRYLNAAMRHLMRYAAGESYDTDSGSPHLAHAAWCLLAVLELEDKKNIIKATENEHNIEQRTKTSNRSHD